MLIVRVSCIFRPLVLGKVTEDSGEALCGGTGFWKGFWTPNWCPEKSLFSMP